MARGCIDFQCATYSLCPLSLWLSAGDDEGLLHAGAFGQYRVNATGEDRPLSLCREKVVVYGPGLLKKAGKSCFSATLA